MGGWEVGQVVNIKRRREVVELVEWLYEIRHDLAQVMIVIGDDDGVFTSFSDMDMLKLNLMRSCMNITVDDMIRQEVLEGGE
jgi:hypothetical protein